MIEQTQRSLQTILSNAKAPIVAWSGGRDSMLLLYLTRQINPATPVVWFKQNISKKWRAWCESIIVDWGLTVFSYPASDTYYLPNDKGLTLIDEYSFGAERVPVLQDVADGGACAINVSRETLPAFAYPWSETLTGYRNIDRHFILGKDFFPEDGTAYGNTLMFAPLRDWTDIEVLQACRQLGVPISMVDERLARCTNCLRGNGRVFCPEANKEIDSIKWNRAEALNNFHARFLPASSEVFTYAD